MILCYFRKLNTLHSPAGGAKQKKRNKIKYNIIDRYAKIYKKNYMKKPRFTYFDMELEYSYLFQTTVRYN